MPCEELRGRRRGGKFPTVRSKESLQFEMKGKSSVYFVLKLNFRDQGNPTPLQHDTSYVHMFFRTQ